MKTLSILFSTVILFSNIGLTTPFQPLYQVSSTGETVTLDLSNAPAELRGTNELLILLNSLEGSSKKVREVSIINAQNMTQKQFDQLCEDALSNYPSLKKVNMPKCATIKNLNGLSNLSIEILDISGCANITSLPYLQNLQTLNASGCKNLRDIKPLYNTKIQNLDLSKCYKFNPKELKDLPLSLDVLNLSQCSQISNADLKYVFATRPQLVSLNLKGCPKVTAKVAKDIFFDRANYRVPYVPMNLIV